MKTILPKKWISYKSSNMSHFNFVFLVQDREGMARHYVFLDLKVVVFGSFGKAWPLKASCLFYLHSHFYKQDSLNKKNQHQTPIIVRMWLKSLFYIDVADVDAAAAGFVVGDVQLSLRMESKSL